MGYLSSVGLNHSMVRNQMLKNLFLINNPMRKNDALVPIILQGSSKDFGVQAITTSISLEIGNPLTIYSKKL